MNYEKRDSLGMYRPFKDDQSGPGPRLMGADTLIGNSVYNHQDESLGEEVASSQRQAVIKLVHLACEPVRCDQEYDFGNSDLATRLREGGTRLSMEQGYWHSPPADALFLHRKIGGLYLLAARLKAKINLYALLAPHLIAKVP